MTQLVGFDWDEGNRGKCEKHGVSVAEIEDLFVRNALAVRPDPAHSATEVRFQAIGLTPAGRHVLIVYTLRHRADRSRVRPISARNMHRREIARYEQDNPSLRKR